jgi:leucyl-tRNA synthetase
MIFANECEKREKIDHGLFTAYLTLIAPFIPHLAEEIWKNLGNNTSIHKEKWPKADPKKLISEKATLAIQVNGKTRFTIEVGVDESEENVKKRVYGLDEIQKWIHGKQIVREVFVPGKIFNIVVT